MPMEVLGTLQADLLGHRVTIDEKVLTWLDSQVSFAEKLVGKLCNLWQQPNRSRQYTDILQYPCGKNGFVLELLPVDKTENI